MRNLILPSVFVIALMGCSNDSPKTDRNQGEPPLEDIIAQDMRGGLRPYKEIATVIKTRLFNPETDLRLNLYVEEKRDTNDLASLLAPSLTDLLASYSGDGLRYELKNAAPNSVNMLLWFLIFEGLGNDMMSLCGPVDAAFSLHATSDFNEETQQVINQLCKWPALESETVLDSAWRLFVNYDAPDAERIAWREFLASPAMQELSGPGAVKQIVLTLLYNPHFLLQK